MLVNNPVTRLLFKEGYNGIDNIFDYWKQNETWIRKVLAMSKITSEELVAFEFKVRWASVCGVFLRQSIEHLTRVSKKIELPLNEIKTRDGEGFMYINDFAKITLKDAVERMDLRGISLISCHHKEVIIKDVDFSYGTLDSSVFDKVSFINCKFDHTSFVRTRFNQCTFDEQCEVKSCDFRMVYLDSEFKCSVMDPIINGVTGLAMLNYKHHMNRKYLKYTIIVDSSFVNNSNDSTLSQYLKK